VIALDSSALMAVVLREPQADACMRALQSDPDRVISAGTLAEALIVAMRRGVGPEMSRLIEALDPAVAPVDEAAAQRAAAAYARWGKGVHPAQLNYGDCFSYVAARDHGCALLYIGDDFAQTDVASAL